MKRTFWSVVWLGAALALSACGGSNPKAGAAFRAVIDIEANQAEQATFSFGVSASGKSIEYVRLEMRGVECAAMSAEHSDYYHRVETPIRNGRFQIEDPGIGVITGQFSGPTQASGSIQIRYMPDQGGALTNFSIHEQGVPCDLGTWAWSTGE